MTLEDSTVVDDEVMLERRHLMSVAFRMLGTVAEAEDAVQETYLRWYRLTQAERDAIEVPAAWLTTAVSRVCLNILGSARRRHETYVGPWLPESVPVGAFPRAAAGEADPADRVTLDETVGMALLVVLEAMTPAERVAFVLHDVFALPFDEIAGIVGRTPAACRQLASSARRRVHEDRRRRVPLAEHDDVVRAFAAAAGAGDLAGMITLLDPQAVLRSDGGGVVSAARRPVTGADRVVRFLLGLVTKNPRATVQAQETPDGLGFAIWDEGRIVGVMTFDVGGAVITGVRMMMNPHKLTLWGAADQE